MFARSQLPLPGFLGPCLPSAAEQPPRGPGWFHEIKLDGFRLLAHRTANGVRLFTRNGLDWAERYPGIAAAVGKLRCQSCLLDGEVVLCGDDGIPVFNRLRYGRQVKGEALLCAFDLLELNGRDLRRAPHLENGYQPPGSLLQQGLPLVH